MPDSPTSPNPNRYAGLGPGPVVAGKARPVDGFPAHYGSRGNPAAKPKVPQQAALDLSRAQQYIQTRQQDPDPAARSRFQEAQARWGAHQGLADSSRYFRRFPVTTDRSEPSHYDGLTEQINIDNQILSPEKTPRIAYRHGLAPGSRISDAPDTLSHELTHAATSAFDLNRIFGEMEREGHPYEGITPYTLARTKTTGHELHPAEQTASLAALQRYLSTTPEGRITDPERARTYFKEMANLSPEEFAKRVAPIAQASPEATRTLSTWNKILQGPQNVAPPGDNAKDTSALSRLSVSLGSLQDIDAIPSDMVRSAEPDFYVPREQQISDPGPAPKSKGFRSLSEWQEAHREWRVRKELHDKGHKTLNELMQREREAIETNMEDAAQMMPGIVQMHRNGTIEKSAAEIIKQAGWQQRLVEFTKRVRAAA